METLRLLSTTQQVDPALFGEEYSDYIDVTEESPFKDYTTLFPKPKGLHFINANTTEFVRIVFTYNFPNQQENTYI